MSTGELGPLQVDPPGVAGVARGLRVKVKLERRGAGDDVVLASGHAEGVEDISTEPDTQCYVQFLSSVSPSEGLLRVPAVHVGVWDEDEVVAVRLAGVGRVTVTAAPHAVQVPAVRRLGRVQPEVRSGQVRSGHAS